MPDFPRASGVLLHPTSLPGPHGSGDLGWWAYRFVDWLAENHQTVWQILPLGPTGYGNSPYQTLSAFAGNPNLISLDALKQAGWLKDSDFGDPPGFPADHIAFGWVPGYRTRLLDIAYRRFTENSGRDDRDAFVAWGDDNAHWLDDFALFASLKEHYNLRPWVEWPAELVRRDPNALAAAREEEAEAIGKHRFWQWLFATQWSALKAYAGENGVRLFGDIPIFVAHDSSDVWGNQHLFYLGEDGQPTIVAGVPPDYFSKTGQRWGNPLYRWDVMSENGYAWWISRFEASLAQVDYVRFDHFRGLAAYWAIPADQETAVIGEWVTGPGAAFLSTVREQLGTLPIIAEDLGVITKDVVDLRDGFDLPGMRVLQFAFSDPNNIFLPHNYVRNTVVYTGTHDNNTMLGWWATEMGDKTRSFISEYLDREVNEPQWVLIRLGMSSVGHTFIIPMQDLLGLGIEARMNTPGDPAGNWEWRVTESQFNNVDIERLKHLTRLFRRAPDQQGEFYGDVAVS